MPPQSNRDSRADSNWIKQQQRAWNTSFVSFPDQWVPPNLTGRERARITAQTTQRFSSDQFNRWFGMSTAPAKLQWGYRAGMPGISNAAPTQSTQTQNWYLDPSTKMVLPLTSEAASQAAAGETPTAQQLIVGGSASGGDATRVEVPGVVDPMTGQIGSLDPVQAESKFAAAKAQAIQDILNQRRQSGQLSPLSEPERLAMDQQAEQMAMEDLSIFLGGNAVNYPKSVAGPGAVPEYKAGQFFPEFDTANPRSITPQEAEVFNFIKNSGVVPDSQNVLSTLFDPKVSTEEKQQIMAAAAGAYSQYTLTVPTAEEGWYWSWNPLEMTGQVLTKALLDPLAIAYEDFIIPAYTWSVAAVPGGVRGATWDEAKSVAPGQMTLTDLSSRFGSAGVRAGTLAGGSFLPFIAGGQIIEGVTQGNWDPLSEFSVGYNKALSGGDAPWKNLGDGIYDAALREGIFEDDYFSSQLSGSVGASVSVIWDPLWVAGPIGKGVRVSHMLGMGAGAIRSSADAASMTTRINRMQAVMRPLDLARKADEAAKLYGSPEAIELSRKIVSNQEATRAAYLQDASPVERFIDWVVSPGEGKSRTLREVMDHSVIENLVVRPQVAKILSEVKTYEEAGYVMRAGLGDRDAIKALEELNQQAAKKLTDLHIQGQIDNIASSPDKYMKVYALLEREVGRSIDELRRLETEAMYTVDPTRAVANKEGFLAQEYDVLDDLYARQSRSTDASEIDALQREIDASRTRLGDALFGPMDRTALPEEVRLAHAKVAESLEKLNGLRNASNFRVRSADEIDIAAREIDELYRQDETLRLALEVSMTDGPWLRNSKQVNFGRVEQGPAQGLRRGAANWRETTRQNKAERKAFQKDTYGQGLKGVKQNGWVRETFRRGSNSVQVWHWAGGAKELAMDALTRPLTMAGMESPSGWMSMTRGAFNDNDREAVALLDSVKMYSDQANWATVVQRRTSALGDARATVGESRVTGAQRKQDILSRFLRNARTNPEKAIRTLEMDIVSDMARYYEPNISDFSQWYDDIMAMYSHLDYERSDLISKVKEKSFWVDENRQKHMSPFIESQLAQGMPLADFRRMERLVRNYSEKGRNYGGFREFGEAKVRASRQLAKAENDLAGLEPGTDAYKVGERTKKQAMADLDRAMKNEHAVSDEVMGARGRLWEGSLRWYDEFQTLWRAGVLFRLGYPTRNAIDGVIRRVTYEASLVPVLEDTVRGARNLASNVATGRVRTDQPFEWMNRAATARKDRLAGNATAAARRGETLPRRVLKWRDGEIRRVTNYRSNVAQRERALQDAIDELKVDTGHLSDEQRIEFDAEIIGLVDHQRALRADVNRLDGMLASLSSDDANVAIAYRQSLDQPRRIGDEFVFGVDGAMYYGMMGDNRLANVLRDAVSSRETQQASLGLSLDIARSTMRAATIKAGGIVTPGDPNYYNALSHAINNHIRNSVVGDLWARNITPREAARTVMRREGERYRKNVGAGVMREVSERNATQAELDRARSILAMDDKALNEQAEWLARGGLADGTEGPLLIPTLELVDEVRQLAKEYRKVRGATDGKDAKRASIARKRERLESELALRLRDRRILDLDARIQKAEKELNEIQGYGMPGNITAPGDARSVYAERTFFTEEELSRPGISTVLGPDTRLKDKYEELLDLQSERAFLTERGMFSDPEDRVAYWLQANGLETFDDVLEAVTYTFGQFDNLLPNPALRDAVLRGQVSDDFLRAQLPADQYTLAAVHGEELALAAGSGEVLSFVQKINPSINKVYSLIGSMPEDTLIRVPFAARVYQDNIRVGSRWLRDEFGDAVPAWAVEGMLKQARSRAVRETKRYMYTQDRRTNFGRVMERFVPFVSAWQNSVMAFSKMFAMNPEMLYFYGQAWRAPDTLGLVDQDGNIRIPMSAGLAPLGAALGGDELVFRKRSMFVLPDQMDPLLTFRAGPVQQIAASNLMQMNLIGPVVPAPVKGLLSGLGLDAEQAQSVWDTAAVLTFGRNEDTGRPNPPSTVPLSLDLALPPSMQKGIQLVQSGFGNTPENNVLYAQQFSRIAREETLNYMQGERETLPSRDEVKQKANALYMTRILNNLIGVSSGPLGAITPPAVDSDVYAAQEAYRLLVDTVGFDEADEVWAQMFGDEALFLVNFRSTRSPGGMPVSIEGLANAEKYNDLIGAIAPSLDADSMPMLGFLLSDGTYSSDDYDPAVRVAQLNRTIPGTTMTWRNVLSPDEQTREASVATGWDMYTSTMTAVYAEMDARGLASLNSSGAADLRKTRDDFLESMRTDPLYAAWHADFQKGSSRKIGSAMDFMRSVIADDGFVAEAQTRENDMWNTAQQWLTERARYYASIRDVKQMNGYEGNDYASAQLRDAWTAKSTQIAETNWRFKQFWVRYLDTDDLTVD